MSDANHHIAREAGRFAPALLDCRSFETVFVEASSERMRLVRIGENGAADSLAAIVAESARRTGRLSQAGIVLDAILGGGDPAGQSVGWAKWAAANLSRQTGDRKRASLLLNEARHTARQVGDLWLELYSSAGIAETARVEGRFAQAECSHTALLRAFSRLGDVRGVVWAWEGLAQIALKTGRHALAAQLFGQALKACAGRDDMRGKGFAHRGLAEVAIASGAAEAGRRHADVAVRLFETAGYAVGVGYARKSLSEIDLASADHDNAAQQLALSRIEFFRAGDARGLLYADLLALRIKQVMQAPTDMEEALHTMLPRVDNSGLLVARAELWKASGNTKA